MTWDFVFYLSAFERLKIYNNKFVYIVKDKVSGFNATFEKTVSYPSKKSKLEVIENWLEISRICYTAVTQSNSKKAITHAPLLNDLQQTFAF